MTQEQVRISIDIEAKRGTPDELVERLLRERAEFYPEWQFTAAGIMLMANRLHASVEHSAIATLEKWVPVQ